MHRIFRLFICFPLTSTDHHSKDLIFPHSLLVIRQPYFGLSDPILFHSGSLNYCYLTKRVYFITFKTATTWGSIIEKLGSANDLIR